jgi:hypothetical protein
MALCCFCSKELTIKGRIMRKDVCPSCGKDLYCCMQCEFHDPSSHNECREPLSDMVRDRDKVNFCGYFRFSGQKADESRSAKEKVKSELDKLFGK